MADLLVVNRSGPNPDSYQRGDVVVVRPDGWEWGRMEDPEKRRAAIGTGAVLDSRGGVPERFRIIRVHGLDWNRIRDWAAPDRTNVETVLGETRMKPINKSRIRVLLDDLPQSSQDDFDATGKTEIDLLTLLSSAREKASGGPPPNPIGG